MLDLKWMDDAACKGIRDFQPHLRDGQRGFDILQREHLARALATCAQCPVTEACASYRKEMHIGFGVWGGKWFNRHKDSRPARIREARTRRLI